MGGSPLTADEWNDRYPIGTPVTVYLSGSRQGRALSTVTTSIARQYGATARVQVRDRLADVAPADVALADVDVRGTVEEELARVAVALTQQYAPPGYRLVWERTD